MSFEPPNPYGTNDGADVVTTISSAPRTRSAEELIARIRNAGGVLVVNASDSDYIVAVNNSLRFSVTQQPDGRIVISESQNLWLLIGLSVLVGAVLILRK